MKRKHGGPGRGQGRHYSPSGRIWLANRLAELKWGFRDAGNDRDPAARALKALHAELHPDGGGHIETTRRLCIRGRGEDNFFSELSAKRHNREPLTDFEQQILEKLSLSWRRRHRLKSSPTKSTVVPRSRPRST